MHPSQRNPRDVVIVSAVRTPLCRAKRGALAKVPPSTLLSTALAGCLSKVDASKFSSSDVEDICIGNVMTPVNAAVARMAQLAASIPYTTPISTTNRQCSSGLQAIANIASSIRSGQIDIGIGGGFESMSSEPMHKQPMPNVDWDVMQSCQPAMDCLIPMGVTSENVSNKYGLTRGDLDAFAANSHKKAALARSRGLFKDEIVPVGDVSEDDGIRPQTTLASLAKLKPVFDPENGSTTAGNASQLTDGAAAVLLMTRQEAERRGLDILGVWRSYAVKGVDPKIMGVGPAIAIPPAVEMAGLKIDDIDVFEINEAFASQASWCVHELKIPEIKVNPNGGAIALGHPLGCTGARQIATLLHHMNKTGKRFGVVSMCIGTGAGAAAVVEVEKRQSSL
uniref:acetyl-CoA C-acyltransferase n=1 Tax=Chaetoceros debilis TaxID=122233 RepID=A0A7S3PXV8_9STRA|mmetsp:Transcript_6284/g.9030  ORF Transcript_6284/g.9030 Transcript_6284/m.9030 type:complete len:394 (-) Transcript_6284:64-1245(-)